MSAASTARSRESEELPAFNSAGFVTERARAFSRTLADLPPLARCDAELWVKYWCSCGFI